MHAHQIARPASLHLADFAPIQKEAAGAKQAAGALPLRPQDCVVGKDISVIEPTCGGRPEYTKGPERDAVRPSAGNIAVLEKDASFGPAANA